MREGIVGTEAAFTYTSNFVKVSSKELESR